MDTIHDLMRKNDSSLAALGIVLAAWEDGTDAGIPPQMMAYAALFAALSDLVGCYGEDAVAGLAETLATRVRSGEFTICDTIQ
ncbi:MAG: hypothetical protein AAF732_09360 [Pseudomonadota bacterium]